MGFESSIIISMCSREYWMYLIFEIILLTLRLISDSAFPEHGARGGR